ncbi:tRNA (guanine-N(7)-)-methyltransferase non-catalytic subunit trm82-like protein [Elsinoe fawcettii]|nr:tRNA (guanine-N(7)-)-methyltransferase non-catalytic subunit trm82-like protein [Elsinoe fawcettii]
MPKRPSAIQITDDSKTIICGDKFGDVYALPLHPSEDGEAQVTHSNGAEQKRVYEPTATETTVHTKRNLKALQEQMRAKGKLIKLTKEPSAFEHKLLLGHVSMLTDMQLTTLEVNGKRRRYIVTCDRDEHIRVSRGIPQAHVTESYCLGHTEFVHRVRQIPDTNILVSAGGDDWLGVWDWTTGQLLGRKDLRPIQNDQGSNKKQIAVSNIWTVVTSNSSSVVIVACEGISKLALITSSNLTVPDGSFSIVDTSDQGQIMDLIDLGAGKVLLSSQRKRLQTFALEGLDTGLTMKHDTSSSSLFEALNNIKIPPTDQESLDGLLNGVERLRKRDNEGEQDD